MAVYTASKGSRNWPPASSAHRMAEDKKTEKKERIRFECVRCTVLPLPFYPIYFRIKYTPKKAKRQSYVMVNSYNIGDKRKLSKVRTVFNFVALHGKARALSLYRKVLLSRLIEETIIGDLKQQNISRGEKRVFFGIGQEAGPIAICDLLAEKDYLIPSYRGCAHVIGKGMSPAKVMSELMARSDGPLCGTGNPGNFSEPALGIYPNSDTLGNNLGTAVGMGLGAQAKNDKRIVAVFFGDGAATRSPFYGALNLSALWDLPILWVCENNQFSLATSYDRMSKTSVAEKAKSFGMHVEQIDGNDMLDIFGKTSRVIEHIRATGHPAFIELVTYRVIEPSDADSYWYKDEEIIQAWKERDPLQMLQKTLATFRICSRGEMDAISKETAEYISQLFQRIKEKKIPSPNEIERLFSQQQKSSTPETLIPRFEGGSDMDLAEAINSALSDEMNKNSAIILYGEDIGMYGGRRGVTKNLLQRFGGKRIIDTPLNEELFVSIAIGAAQTGLRPIAEFSHAAFLTLALNDIIRAGFWKIINLGKFPLPIILRSTFGSGYDECGEELANSPLLPLYSAKNIRIVMPSNAYQAKGILHTALRTDEVVVFFEHRLLYHHNESIPEGDFTFPLGKGVLARKGKDITIIGYGYLTHLALSAAEELAKSGIDADVLDLVSLKPLDEDLIHASVKKTKRAIILDENTKQEGIFPILYSSIMQSVPQASVSWLGVDARILPFGARASAFLPQTRTIVAAAKNLLL